MAMESRDQLVYDYESQLRCMRQVDAISVAANGDSMASATQKSASILGGCEGLVCDKVVEAHPGRHQGSWACSAAHRRAAPRSAHSGPGSAMSAWPCSGPLLARR